MMGRYFPMSRGYGKQVENKIFPWTVHDGRHFSTSKGYGKKNQQQNFPRTGSMTGGHFPTSKSYGKKNQKQFFPRTGYDRGGFFHEQGLCEDSFSADRVYNGRIFPWARVMAKIFKKIIWRTGSMTRGDVCANLAGSRIPSFHGCNVLITFEKGPDRRPAETVGRETI